MRTALRVIALIACVAMILYGIYAERHEVSSYMNDEVEEVDGLEFTKGATIDRFMLHEDKLYDGHGVAPEPVKECPT